MLVLMCLYFALHVIAQVHRVTVAANSSPDTRPYSPHTSQIPDAGPQTLNHPKPLKPLQP